MNKEDQKALAELEYSTLRKNNAFKRKKKGFKLFLVWRAVPADKQWGQNTITAKKLGIAPEGLVQLRNRLNGSLEKLKDQLMPADAKRRHVEKVAKKMRMIEKSDDLSGKTDKPFDPNAYDLYAHIEEEMTHIGGPDTKDWMAIMLYVSKYIFINEVSTYRKFQEKVLVILRGGEDKKLMQYVSVADRKASRIRDLIHDHIGQWGTLHTQSVTETFDEQESKIIYLTKKLVEIAPHLLPEIIDELDMKENNEAADIMDDIMGDEK